MKAAELYDRDFAQWAERNAELLRARKFAEADIPHIADQIEELVKRDRLEIRARLVRLIEHLLKWQFRPERRAPAWERTVFIQRRSIEYLLRDSPSLRPSLDSLAEAAYQDAAKIVSRATGWARKDLSETCPYTAGQLLDVDFLPEGKQQ
jgi:hypothetical protein